MWLRVLLAQVSLAALTAGMSSSLRQRSGHADVTYGSASYEHAERDKEERTPLRPDELSPEIVRHAKEILEANQRAPLGTEVPFEVDGHAYVGRIEQHYHEPGGTRRPWGRHRGVTVYHGE